METVLQAPIGWMEATPIGRGAMKAEWELDREKLVRNLKRVIGVAGRIPYLNAEQMGEIMSLMMNGIIGYYGRAVPLDRGSVQAIVGVQEYVARNRGYGTGKPHLMLFDEEGGLGWPHPYEVAAATLMAQVDEMA